MIEVEHHDYGRRWLVCEGSPELVFTENDTDARRLYAVANSSPYLKDGINDYVVHGTADAVNPGQPGTKATAHYRSRVPPGERLVVRLRFTDQTPSAQMFGEAFDAVFTERVVEADEFYARRVGRCASQDALHVQRQAFAGMPWSKQFYHYDLRTWLEGDPAGPPPPHGRRQGRNRE